MACEASEDAGDRKQTEEMLQSLGAQDWNIRRDAVHGLAATAGSDLIQQLLRVLRDQHRDLSRLNGAMQVLVHTTADVVPQLLQLLSHADADVRTYSALTLGERGDPRAASGLIGALADSDANVRMHAVEALGRLRSVAAVDALIEIVEAQDFELAFPAIDALIAIGDERIAHRLLPLLKDSLLKIVATEALGWMGDEEVVKPLLDLMADPDVPRATVAIALCRIHQRYEQRYGDSSTIPAIVRSLTSPASTQAWVASVPLVSPAVVASWANILSWLPGPDATAALVNLLDRPPIDVAVAQALLDRGPKIVPDLLRRLASTTEEGRKTIIEVLTRLGDRSAVPALLQVLETEEDEDLLVRTVDSLARLADSRAYQPLRILLGHPSARVRHSAVAAVNSLGHPNTAADLSANFLDSSPLLRESSIRVAAYLGLPTCIDSVFDCCGEADERVRRAAIESLANLDDSRVLQRLGQAIRTDTPAVRAAAAAALGKVENPDGAAEFLVDALTDGDVWVRYFAVRSLLSIKKQRSVVATLMRLATDDAAMQVRVAAIEALGECGADALPVLLELSRSALPDVANAAILALGAFPSPQGKQRLLETIHSPEYDRQIQAIRAMGRTNNSDFVEPLRACLQRPDQRLATEAALALSQIRSRESALALITSASRPSQRKRCIDALTSMGDAAIPALAYGLRTCDLDTRRAIVEVLCCIRSVKAMDALSIAMEDEQPSIRHGALSALAHLRRIGPAATPAASVDVCEGKP